MRPRIDVALLLLSSIMSMLASASLEGSVSDESSLLQRHLEGQQPNAELFNSQMRSWLDGYYGILRTKGDEWLTKCCDLHRETGIDPWNSWGTATEEQQKTWQDSNCNAIVGSAEEDVGIGAPNCAVGIYDSLLRNKPIGVALHQVEDEGCDDIDRESIDDEFFDRESIPDTMSIECNSDHLLGSSGVNFTMLASCTKSILKLSDTCTGCYTDFIKNVGGTSSTPGCFAICHKLTYCLRKDQCTSKAKLCAACVQPALIEYNRCIGGKIYNPFTIDNFLKKIVRFSAH